MKKVFLFFIIICTSCNIERPTEFSEFALNDTVYSLNNHTLSVKEVFQKYKGKKVVVDFWASWCRDCLKSMPSVRNLQKEYPEVVFLFLSVDRNEAAWKNGIKRLKIDGEHYYLPKGMKSGEFVDFVGLGWIPRFMVIDEQGKIRLFKATSASDSSIEDALKKVI